MRDKPLLIWGAGAMGGSIGASLVRGGISVLFLDKVRDHVEVMNREGLRIEGPVEEFLVPAEARHPDDLQGRFFVIFLCVKAQHTREATEQLEPHLEEDGVVVSIQNGLCELEIAEVVGSHRTVGAFVNFGADYLGPGVIHRGNRGAVVVGELDGAVRDRTRRIHGLLKIFDPDVLLTDNIFGFLWGKLAYASLLFATAVTDGAIADVLAQEGHRPVLTALAREAVGIAMAKGIELEGFDGFDPLAFTPGAPTHRPRDSLDDLVRFNRASAKTHSGIWRDLAIRKRPTEVDAQLGWIVRCGKEVGTPTPLTEALIHQIHEIESGSRALAQGNLTELRSIL